MPAAGATLPEKGVAGATGWPAATELNGSGVGICPLAIVAARTIIQTKINLNIKPTEYSKLVGEIQVHNIFRVGEPRLISRFFNKSVAQ